MTTSYALGDVIAERRIQAIAADGTSTDVVLKVGRPAPDPLPGGDWRCPHQIVGLGDEAVSAAFGVDTLQALLLSVHALQLKLADRAVAASVELDWLGQPDLGLKVA